MRKLIVVGIVAALVLGLHDAVVRPWLLRWGATDAEVARALPGDALVPDAVDVSTRAVTIAAPPERVWPWIAQLGQDRAGFYSYDLLENLVGCEMPRATRVLADRQRWRLGDSLWMYPPRKLSGMGGARLDVYEPGRCLVFATHRIGTPSRLPPDGTWGFYLEPVGSQATRLITRSRAGHATGRLSGATDRWVFEPAHHAMERQMLLNIQALAEGRRTSHLSEAAAVALWTLVVVVLLVDLVEVARRRRWIAPLAGAVGAALLFQLLTLVQPPPLAGAALLLSLALATYPARPTPPRTRLGMAMTGGASR